MAQRRAVIVDDERLARVELCSMLAKDPSVVVVGEAADVTEAVAVIEREQPDLLFLDIQLGGATGFDVLERVDIGCDVIFVTAYDQHAVRAFEVNALDYLLKPVNPERLGEALERSASRSQTRDDPLPELDADDHLFVRVKDRWQFLQVNTIRAIEAAGDYTRVRTTEGASFLLHKSLREWEDRLPEKLFVRIHRSTIVNLDQVARVEEWSGQTFRVYLNGIEKPYRMSRRAAARLKG